MSQIDHETRLRFLRFKVYKGFRDAKLPLTQEYIDRIEYELKIIGDMKFEEYFLIVADLCYFMRSRKIKFLVRGSGCGSCVVWGLGISRKLLDPIRFKLPFERFLNPSRISMPDLDIDIQDDRRNEMIEYTLQKYGKDRVGRIITFGTMGAKQAIQDTLRVEAEHLKIKDPQQVAAEISALIPAGKGEDGKNIRLADELKRNEALREKQRLYPTVFEKAMQLEGRLRHASIHAAGIIIAPDVMTKFVPLFFKGNPETREPEDWFPTIQWDMYDAEARGMLKMDFLGLKTLRVIDQTEKMINSIHRFRHEPADFDIEEISTEDQRTWELFAAGRTSGIFQVERQFVQNFCRRMNLTRREIWQLAVLVAIIRPGMMDSGNTERFLRRAMGQEPATPAHPLLADTFAATFGLMCFQEDVMEAAKDFAGFTMGEADVLRKGVGKKNPAFIAKQKPMFYEGGQQPRVKVVINGKTFITKPRNPDLKKALEAVGAKIDLTEPQRPLLMCDSALVMSQIAFEVLMPGATKEECDTIWHNIEDHARYSFNNAHAAAYGMCGSYPTGFLKANHAVIFMNNLINSEAGGVSKEDGYNYKVSEYVEEARSMGIKVLPPCVKSSESMCKMVMTPDGEINTIRFGLTLIKKLSSGAVDWILKHARHADSLKDFILACYELRLSEQLHVTTNHDTGAQVTEKKSEWKVYTRVGKTDLEALAMAGALDIYDGGTDKADRQAIFTALPALQKLAHKFHDQTAKIRNGKSPRITPESVMTAIRETDIKALPTGEPMTLEQKIEREREVTGCFLSFSPFDPFWPIINKWGTCTPANIKAEDVDYRGNLIFPAVLSRMKEIVCKNGKSRGREMAHMNWVGVDGDIEAPAFPDTWDMIRNKCKIDRNKVYLVKVRPDNRNPGKVYVDDIMRLSNEGLGR